MSAAEKSRSPSRALVAARPSETSSSSIAQADNCLRRGKLVGEWRSSASSASTRPSACRVAPWLSDSSCTRSLRASATARSSASWSSTAERPSASAAARPCSSSTCSRSAFNSAFRFAAACSCRVSIRANDRQLLLELVHLRRRPVQLFGLIGLFLETGGPRLQGSQLRLESRARLGLSREGLLASRELLAELVAVASKAATSARDSSSFRSTFSLQARSCSSCSASVVPAA